MESADSKKGASAPLKDHEIAALVNKLTLVAKSYHNHQSLRQRISVLVVQALKGKS
jgi:sulfur carrier protein ThiS